jgi:23S rRNA (guanosine2251-2'-O)-methyltransferase
MPRPRRDHGERWVYGRHAVAAALANPARRWRRLAVLAGQEAEAAALAEAAAAVRHGEGEAVQSFDRAALDRLLPEGAVHQGWALEVEPLAAADLDDVLRAVAVTSGRSIVILLDQVSDPHNVGAILRSAAAFGARAVILAEHGAPPASGVLAKAASGALDSVPLVRGSQPRAHPRPAEGGWVLVLRSRRGRAGAARQPRSRAARGAGVGRGRRRAAAPVARALRFSRPAADPAGPAEPQCLERRGGRALRTGARRAGGVLTARGEMP